MVQAIDHDAISSTATAGSKAVKWGAIGAIAAILLPVGLGIGAVYAGGAAISAIAAGSIGSAVGAAILSVAAGIGAYLSGAAMGVMAGGAAIGGGLFGLSRAGSQVAQEKAAYRDKVAQRQGAAQKPSDLSDLKTGYSIGRTDGEQVGFQKGYNALKGEIIEYQQRVVAQQEAEQRKSKPPVTLPSGKVIASCACTAESILQKKEEAAAGPKQHGG